MNVVQSVESKAEILAQRIAKVWFDEGPDAASKFFHTEATNMGLNRGECSAVGNIATAMIHGKRWKK